MDTSQDLQFYVLESNISSPLEYSEEKIFQSNHLLDCLEYCLNNLAQENGAILTIECLNDSDDMQGKYREIVFEAYRNHDGTMKRSIYSSYSFLIADLLIDRYLLKKADE